MRAQGAASLDMLSGAHFMTPVRRSAPDSIAPLLRAAALLRALLALPLAATHGVGSLFGKEDDYAPDEPPDKLYNEGLFLLEQQAATTRTPPRNSRKSTASTLIRNGRASR